MRLELMTPQGDLVQSETYNNCSPSHGVIMIFFFLIPSIPAVAREFPHPYNDWGTDLAFPRLNLASGTSSPLGASSQSRQCDGWGRHRLDVLHPLQQHLHEQLCRADDRRIFVAGFSTILTGLNFIVTIHTMRARG